MDSRTHRQSFEVSRRIMLGGMGAAFTCMSARAGDSYGSSDLDRIVESIGDARFVAIGEIHDNPKHHEIQAQLVRRLKPDGLAFEMIPERSETLVNSLRRIDASRQEIGRALQWDESGWPAWDQYAPILEAAPDAYIAGGGLSRSLIGSIHTEGLSALGEKRVERYELDEPLDKKSEAALLDLQFHGHCELIEREKLGGMLRVQRAWDASFAEAWRRASVRGGGGRSILICGAVHARLDIGAPAYLDAAGVQGGIASVGLSESDEPNTGTHTEIISTPRMERPDPCIELRKRFGQSPG